MNILRKKYKKEQNSLFLLLLHIERKIYADLSELLGFGLHF